MRKFIASTFVTLALVAMAAAGEHTGIVTKFEDGKLILKDFSGLLQGGEATDITIVVADNVKILKGKIDIQGGFAGGAIPIEADGDYPGGKEAFAKAVKEATAKKADDKKADDKKADDKKAGKKVGGFGGMFGGPGVFAHVITEGEGDKAKVVEIRVIDIGNLKK
ncbi:MAG TPA: hypothetical protein VE988_29365, partial [Gemmataceae bacterium]|nr:hypothetical protein [Gemmataceae bacterium]